jgi:hypothetical protein
MSKEIDDLRFELHRHTEQEKKLQYNVEMGYKEKCNN